MSPHIARQHSEWLANYAVDAGAPRLDPETVKPAADRLNIDPVFMQAVILKESSGEPYQPDGKATICYEKHQFSKRTGHKWDAVYPSISAK